MKMIVAASALLSTVLLSVVLPSSVIAVPFDNRPSGPDDRPPMHHQGPEHDGPDAPPRGLYHEEKRAEPMPEPPHQGGEPRHSMPRDAEALLIGGITYYVLNGLYYQHHGSEYVTVAPPPQAATSVTTLDYNGRRYYVQHGHYYSRSLDGEYVEVSRPQGL